MADIDRLVEGDAELHAGRNADHLRQRRAESVDDFHRIGDGLFIDAQVDRAGSVRAHDVRLDVRGVGHDAEIPDADRVALLVHLYNDVLDRIDRLESKIDAFIKESRSALN